MGASGGPVTPVPGRVRATPVDDERTGPGTTVLGPVEPPADLLGPDDDPSDPTAVSVRTSGSTGVPKRVLLSASALFASAAATHDRLGGSGQWLLALPAQHVAGMQVLVRSLVAGTTPVVMDLTGSFTPAGFAAATARLTGRRLYTSLVPTQLTRILDAADPAALEALRRYDAILVGGSATSPALLERAVAAGARPVTTYGMSETAGGCVYDGVPLDGVDIALDEDTGRIRIGGPVLARGYLGDRAATAGVFAGGRFVTSDHGTWDGPVLRVGGRLDSMIISGGVNIAPGPVEAALHRLPGVAEAVVVGVPDPEWGQRVAAAIVLSPGAQPPNLAQARALVTELVSARSAPRQLTVLDHLPLRGPGKPDRAAITTILTSS
ncbi:o-succinylbenzoate--CoA ligase [Kineosporia sp. J2-2]|uniref:O-succinylbenzoate--CoA ligase n=1 Tax=Kineosporia corallincola TaxID=2835133 RepID=A0ABS5TCC2_9ACTN|nr:o-succinylbenzoate--CoA ligase [Kineosporia corallincola]MBT0767758.1 o-succinylbenzoate--CoA ligase [Kineosporia corallincola]